MEPCRIDTSQFKDGDRITIHVHDFRAEEVEMKGRDSCPNPHPIWIVASGPNKGKRISCGDVIYATP